MGTRANATLFTGNMHVSTARAVDAVGVQAYHTSLPGWQNTEDIV